MPQSNRALRAKLQKLLNERGNLFHFYSTRIANQAIDLTQAMRDLAEENAKVEGDIAALFIEAGRPDDDESGEPETEQVAVSMCTTVSRPVSTRVAVTAYENGKDSGRRMLDDTLHTISGLPRGWTGLM